MFMKNHVIGLEDRNWRDKRDGLKKKERNKGEKMISVKKGKLYFVKIDFRKKFVHV